MPRQKAPSVETHLASIRADLATITDPSKALSFLDALTDGIKKLRAETQKKSGPRRHLTSVGERLEAWIQGTFEEGELPELTEAQAQALRDLFAKTRILSVKVSEPEPGLHWVDVVFRIGEWKAKSHKEYSFARERSTATVGEVITTYGLSLEPLCANEKALRAAAKAIPSKLPKQVLFAYLYLVGLDDELFCRWNPWIEDLDLREWPLRSLRK